MQVNQIEQRIEKNPNGINEVPVEAGCFNRRCINGGVPAEELSKNDDADDADADEQMQSMQARDDEVLREEHLGGLSVRARIGERRTRQQMVVDMVGVFESLDDQKGAAESHGAEQQQRRWHPESGLRRDYGKSHGQTARDQDSRVDGAEGDGHVVAGFGEPLGMEIALHRVPKKETAKKHDLGSKKNPHAERGALRLLLEVAKVLAER